MTENYNWHNILSLSTETEALCAKLISKRFLTQCARKHNFGKTEVSLASDHMWLSIFRWYVQQLLGKSAKIFYLVLLILAASGILTWPTTNIAEKKTSVNLFNIHCLYCILTRKGITTTCNLRVRLIRPKRLCLWNPEGKIGSALCNELSRKLATCRFVLEKFSFLNSLKFFYADLRE